MEWRVIKMGAEIFDTLHAYGAGVLVAHAMNEQVIVQDEGCFYRLSCSSSTVPLVPIDLLDDIFELPSPDDVLRVQPPHSVKPLAPANLDGLLAALFTRPDAGRSCSLSALLRKQRLDPTVLERGVESVRNICTRWKAWTAQEISPAAHWLGELLKGYDTLCPLQPLPGVTKQSADITVTMALDPSLAYASRQALSDGRVARKVNMTVRGTRFAPLLAYIGAMRFLRAQPVAADLIAYSVPVASTLTLCAESARPLLMPRDDDEPERALLLQALDLVTDRTGDEGQWTALSYQVLQSQAKQQAISRSRGILNLDRLKRLKNHQGEHLLLHWKWLLRMPQKERPYELDHLAAALVTGQRQEWEAHVSDVAEAELARRLLEDPSDQAMRLRLYRIDEVKGVSATMESPLSTPLSAIAEGKEGTMRFGHALRQLRERAPSMAREILESLEPVQTGDQLMDALTSAMETCEVMGAKSPFLIVPTDRDLKLLLEDVERYGARTIAKLLRLLSTLRNAPRKEEVDHVEGTQIPSEPPDSGTREAPAVLDKTRASEQMLKGKSYAPISDADHV
jgi:hypothetical protein